jgi:beta-barrel assembly-enhancing protease
MRKLNIWTLALALLAWCATPAWAQFPDLARKIAEKGKKFADVNKPWTPDQETAVGESSAAKLISIFGLYENPEMVKYVNLVGNTVARQGARTDINYRFGILDTEAVNAMAMPGGFIFVTRGALANMKDEAQLAGVLAHEVAHVDGKHLEKEIKSKGNLKLAMDTASEQVSSKVGWSAGQLTQLGSQLVVGALTMQYSRDKESEADKRGMDFLANAGYASTGLSDFLQALANASGEAGNKRALNLFGSTHPPFGQRVTALAALIPKYPTNGQVLQERFVKYVNPRSFLYEPAGGGVTTAANVGSAFAPSGTSGGGGAGGQELDGIVSKGVVVLMGGKLPEGTRVKVRPQ